MLNKIKNSSRRGLMRLDARRQHTGDVMIRSRTSEDASLVNPTPPSLQTLTLEQPTRPTLPPLETLTSEQRNEIKRIEKRCDTKANATPCNHTEFYAVKKLFPDNCWDPQTAKLVLKITQKATDDPSNPYLQKLSDNILDNPKEWETLSLRQLQRKTLHCLQNPSLY